MSDFTPPEVARILDARGFEYSENIESPLPWWDKLESPIEEMWVASLFIRDDELDARNCGIAGGNLFISSEIYQDFVLMVSPQWDMGKVLGRADFKVNWLSEDSQGALAIECDGHEWHERTKEQAARDRHKDRRRLARGIPTLRFTGSEIHAKLDSLLSDVWSVCNTISSGRLCA